jgi:hypothetical protein
MGVEQNPQATAHPVALNGPTEATADGIAHLGLLKV